MKTRFFPAQEFCLDLIVNCSLTRAPQGLVNCGALQKTARTRGILGRQAPQTGMMKTADFRGAFRRTIREQLERFGLIVASLHADGGVICDE